ncbi:MAG: hypothetical protein R6W89_03650 [Candidatus Hydrogenedentota bacterium]
MIAALPGMLVFVFTGYGLIQFLLHQPPSWLLFIALALAVGVSARAWGVFATPEQQDSDSEKRAATEQGHGAGFKLYCRPGLRAIPNECARKDHGTRVEHTQGSIS